MRITLALVATLLVFQVRAGQVYEAWWDCVAAYVVQHDFLTAHPEGPLALSAMTACYDISPKPEDDLGEIKAMLAHFRRMNSIPDVRPRTRGDLRF